MLPAPAASGNLSLMFAKLLVIAGPDRGKRFEMVPAVPLVLGRSREADVRLADPRVSPNHCKLSVRNATLFIMDMDSLTGTSVNNMFVTVEYPLQLGDTFTVGDTTVLVQDPDAPDPPMSEEPKAQASNPKPAAPSKPPEPPKPPPPVAKPQAVASDLPDRPEQITGHDISCYRVGTLLFRGRTGFVFNAQDQKHHRPVALKVMTAAFTADDLSRTQFTRSMKLALPLRHPNVVSVLGAGKTGQYCWVAMELVSGESLTATIRHVGVAGSLDWRRALRMSIYLSRGLTYLHEQKIVYRNIGPQNILCEGDAKVPRLSDLVRIRPFFDPVEPGQGEEMPDSLLLYAAPEQTREETEIDYRSDIFNLGALCYSLVTGRPPFEGGSLAETITKIRREKPEDPKKYQLAIPKAFEGVILQMLAKRPEDRYQTTAEVLRDLERVLKYQGMTL
jgi:Protein kinase domain/Inner membrane component of T3SS, cytoplasmic domain